MHVLVTGVSGFLGGRLARLLLREGHQVRGAFRPGDDLSLVRELPGLELRPCDLLDRGGARGLVAGGVEAVVHTAALVSFDPARYEQQLQLNVEGTGLLLQAARAAGVRRMIYTGTVNTLGIPPAGSTGDERTPFNWHRYGLGYMDSKKAAQDLVLGAALRGEMEAVALLPGTFFGPGDLNRNAGRYILEGAEGRLLAAPPGGTSVVHVDDVAYGHLLALERGRSGARYVLGGENMSYHRLFSVINEALGRPPPRLTLPSAPLRLAGLLCDRLRKTGVNLPFSEGLAVAASSELYYSSELACRELGYRFRPAREAILDAVAWYRQQGVISA